jgi:hypothetical protein
MALLLALLLLDTPARKLDVDWMRLDAFHLSIGMTRMQVLSNLAAWTPKQGKDSNELLVDYTDDKSLTLEFRNERLHAVRFEYFVMLPQVRLAFERQRAQLEHDFGKPRKATKSILIYDDRLPNVMVAVTDDPNSEQGKQGLGVLAVRYHDPR